MVTLELTDEQLKYVFMLLDHELRSGGLSALSRVVDLHNVLSSAPKGSVKKNEKPETNFEKSA